MTSIEGVTLTSLKILNGIENARMYGTLYCFMKIVFQITHTHTRNYDVKSSFSFWVIVKNVCKIQ